MRTKPIISATPIIRESTAKELQKEKATWKVISASLSEITIHALSQPLNEREPVSLQDYIMLLFDGIDAQYKLIEKLDVLIDFKKIFGPILGAAIEKFDDSALRAIIKHIIIPILVGVFSPNKAEKLDEK